MMMSIAWQNRAGAEKESWALGCLLKQTRSCEAAPKRKR